MNRQRMRLIQLGLEALIPLLGFFAWNWSLYFILLFYFLDVLAAEAIMHLKSKRIIDYSGQKKKEWILFGAVSVLVLLTTISLIHLAMLFIQKGIQFPSEIAAFWQYEEMGIQQGYLFVPLALLMAYQQYKMEFLVPARYRTANLKSIWQTHTRAMVVAGVSASLCLGIATFVALPEIVYVLGIVLVTSLYKLTFAR